MAFGSLAELVQHFENPTGNPALYNQQGGTASGLYQFVPSTWRNYLAQIGGNTSLYPTAASAPANVQDAVFAQAVSQRGLGDWTCPGCDPPLTNYLAANPSAAGLPTLPGGSAQSPALGGDGGASVGAGGPSSITQPGSLADKAGISFSGLTNWLQAVAGRTGLFLLALVFLGGAFLLFAMRSGDQTPNG